MSHPLTRFQFLYGLAYRTIWSCKVFFSLSPFKALFSLYLPKNTPNFLPAQEYSQFPASTAALRRLFFHWSCSYYLIFFIHKPLSTSTWRCGSL